MEGLGFSAKDDVTSDLRPARMKKNITDLASIKRVLNDTMNPFTVTEKNALYSLSSGKAVSENTEVFLTSVEAIGERKRNQFVDECCADPNRFEARIEREKLSTFANEGATKKTKNGSKEVHMKMERNIFARLLHMALERKVDMAEVMKYPLTPVPLALCQIDGSMRSTSKSQLMKHLKKRINSTSPAHIDVKIVDGFFFLHQLREIPATFGRLANFILRQLCHFGPARTDLVFDRFFSPSIKDLERTGRNAGQDINKLLFNISGPQMVVPSNFRAALRNSNFKESLVSFLVDYWSSDDVAYLFEDKVLYVTEGDRCFSFRSVDGRTVKLEENDLMNHFEEADHRMFHHVNSIITPANVVIRAQDSDIGVIALGVFHCLQNDLNLWIEVGLFTDNTLEYINVNELYMFLGRKLCQALPAFYIFTGSDYTAAFHGRGKIRPFKLLETGDEFQEAFASIGSSETVPESMVQVIEKFVCQMYGKAKLISVDEARLQMFVSKYKVNEGKPLKWQKLKNMDSSSWPPCLSVLRQKIKRTNLAANILQCSHSSLHSSYPPLDNGWQIEEDMLSLKWFEGEVMPSNLEDFTAPFDESEDSDDFSGDESGDSDTEEEDMD